MFYVTSCITLIILMTSYPHVKMEDCSPPGQPYITCNSTGNRDECVKADNMVDENISPISKVVLTDPDVYMNPETNKNGVAITWTSQSANDLNVTKGFIIWLYRYSGSQKYPVLCRFYQIRSSVTVSNSIRANAVFSLHIESLEYLNTEYQISVLPVPHSTIVNEAPAAKLFFTNSNLKPTANSTFDTSQPFSVTTWFRRTSYYPHLAKLYNHVKYNVSLLDRDKGFPKDLLEQDMKQVEVPTSNVTEYAEVRFDYLRPGAYRLDVTPFKLSNRCFKDCQMIVDHPNVFISDVFYVKGIDYDPPNAPILEISSTNNITVTFYLSPRSHLIRKYDIKIGTPNSGGNTMLKEYIVTGEETSPTVKIFFSQSDVERRYRYPDQVRAQVIPVYIESLCGEAGKCNINGTCIPCAQSYSTVEKLKNTSVNMALVISVTASVGGIILLVIVMLVVLKFCRPHTSFCPPAREEVKEPDPVPPKICLAYIRDEIYDHLNETLRTILEHHFHCDVVIYTGSQDRSVYQDCDCILVVYSWPLLEALKLLEQAPVFHQIPQEYLKRKNVLDLLTQPLPLDSPRVLLALFDHVDVANSNPITDKNSELIPFRLPSQIKQLTTCVYTANYTHPSQVHVGNQAMLKSFSRYTGSPMAETLNKAIADVKNYDSGYDTLTMNTIQTMATAQLVDLDQAADGDPNVGAAPVAPPVSEGHEQAPVKQSPVGTRLTLATGQAPTTDRTITMGTTTPYAAELQYFNPRLQSIGVDMVQPDLLPTPTSSHLPPLTGSLVALEPEFSSNDIQMRDMHSAAYAIIDETSIPASVPEVPVVNDGTVLRQESTATSGLSSFPSSVEGGLPEDCISVSTNRTDDCDSVLAVEGISSADDSFKCSTVDSSMFHSNIESTRTTYHV